MNSRLWCWVCLVMLSFAAIVSAAEPLPRVLFLGDSVHRQMIDSAAREMKDCVKIEYPKIDAPDSGGALASIDRLLGDGKWDVIYFNFGFGDLHYKDPKSKEIRAMARKAGGVRVTTPQEYGKNLESLVVRLKATGARLVWASTTPMVELKDYAGLYDAGSEVEYNRIAAGVMQKHGVAINDMHTFVMQKVKDGKHPWFLEYHGTIPLHEPVIETILGQIQQIKKGQ